MQRIVKFVLAILFFNTLIAQTNTFPLSGNVGIGTTSPSSLLDVKTNLSQQFGLTISPSGSHHSYLAIDRKTGYDGGMLWRKDGNFIWQNVNSDNNGLLWYSYTGNTGGQQVLQLDKEGYLALGSHQPMSRLHMGGSNQELRLDYNGTNNYYGSMRWSGLQLGNNGQNRIIAGRTSAGGWLDFYVNNTNEGVDYHQAPNGLLAMRLSSNGNVGIGTTNPQQKLHISGGDIAFDAEQTERFIRINNSFGGAIRLRGNSVSSVDRGLQFGRFDGNNNWSSLMTIETNNGNVGIGTITPSEKLSVNGNIRAKKLIVTQQNWSDYVFYKGYKLRPLQEVEKYIQQHQHLPEVPSAKEVQAIGISLGDTQALLLKKIEELTLYIINQEKRIIQLEKNKDISKTRSK